MKQKKRLCLSTVIAVFLLFSVNGIQAQSKPIKLNRNVISKYATGKWKENSSLDTAVFWRIGYFGKSFPINTCQRNETQRHIYILIM